jgi:hypothetical protein
VLSRLIFVLGLLWLPVSSCGLPRNPSPQEPLSSDVLRCDVYESCSNDHGCPTATDCIKLAGCRHAVCIDAGDVCRIACASAACTVLESAPLQMRRCPDGRSIRGG